MRAVLLALLASSLVLPLVAAMTGLVVGDIRSGLLVGMLVTVVTVPHVLLLGLPIFLLLRRLGRAGAVPMAFAGFLAGLLPAGLYSWPYWSSDPGHSAVRNWHGRPVIMVEDGLPTLYGVLAHLENMLVLGLLGAVCALVFWGVWRSLQQRSAANAYILSTPVCRDDGPPMPPSP